MYNLMQINMKFYFSRSITKNIKQKIWIKFIKQKYE